jgi:group II intron reverse transcriptase/maturase
MKSNQENDIPLVARGFLQIKRRRSDIPNAERLQILQEKLSQKAKQEPDYVFYVLYDKVFIAYVLEQAWKQVKAKNSAAGIDNQTIADVEMYGVEKYLEELREDLRKQSYQPQAIKRVYIPKANGKLRPIGIGVIRDRIVQTAVKMIIEPIFEADFEDCSHGFRPKRSAKGAIKSIKENLNKGKTSVYDADLSAYFDTIPHNKLMKVLKMRISDPRLLKLIDKFLKVPIKEKDGLTGGRKNKKGVPQGGILSPVLANIYMNLIDKAVSRPNGIFKKAGIEIIRYADDFILMSEEKNEQAQEYLKELLSRMELRINEDKTKELNAKETSFNFLGFTFRYDRSIYTYTGINERYWNVIPSDKALNKLKEKIREVLHSSLHFSPERLVAALNRLLRGWLNYYDIKGVSYAGNAKSKIRNYLYHSLYRYFNRKSQRKSRLYRQQAFEILVNRYKLIDPVKF